MTTRFGTSTRAEQMRFVVLAGALFALSWWLLDVEWMVALVIGGATSGVYVLLNVLYKSWRSSIVVDETGIVAIRSGKRTRIDFDDVAVLDVTNAGLPMRGGVATVRYGFVADALGRRISFADLSLLGASKARDLADSSAAIISIGEPEILLAILAQKTGNAHLLPDSMKQAVTADQDEAPASSFVEDPGESKERRIDYAGLGVVGLKLGGKLVKAVISMVKMIKPGAALLASGVFAIFLDWKFVIGIMAMLAFHELGHVWAMRRSGLPVKGVYFIPLVGAAAVTDGVWKTRGQQAYIALNGPLWGLFITVPMFAASYFLGDVAPWLPAMAAFWALINLFNLLPINPLDGGRLLNAVGHSFHSWLGVGISVGAFVASFALAFALDIGLLVVVGIFGLLEFINELEAWNSMRKLRSIGLDGTATAEGLLSLRLLARPAFRDKDETKLRAMEVKRLTRLIAVTRVKPMSLLHTALWGCLYLILAGGFVVIIVLSSHDPAAAIALEALR